MEQEKLLTILSDIKGSVDTLSSDMQVMKSTVATLSSDMQDMKSTVATLCLTCRS